MSEVTHLHAGPDRDAISERAAVERAVAGWDDPLPGQLSPPARVQLTRWQRMEVESARELVMNAGDMLVAGRPAAYVVGLIEGAGRNLLDLLDAVCEVD